MTPLSATLFAFATSVVPLSDHAFTGEPEWSVEERYQAVADAAASVALSEDPLPEMSQARTGLVLMAVAWRESFFRREIVWCWRAGSGNAWGAFQAQGGHLRARACESVESGARLALEMLRESWRACRHRPLFDRASWYTDGPALGCPTPWPRSRARVAPAFTVLLFQEEGS